MARTYYVCTRTCFYRARLYRPGDSLSAEGKVPDHFQRLSPQPKKETPPAPKAQEPVATPQVPHVPEVQAEPGPEPVVAPAAAKKGKAKAKPSS